MRCWVLSKESLSLPSHYRSHRCTPEALQLRPPTPVSEACLLKPQVHLCGGYSHAIVPVPLNTGSHQRKPLPQVTAPRSLRVACRYSSAEGQAYFLTDSTLLGVAERLSQPALTTHSVSHLICIVTVTPGMRGPDSPCECWYQPNLPILGFSPANAERAQWLDHATWPACSKGRSMLLPRLFLMLVPHMVTAFAYQTPGQQELNLPPRAGF